MKIVLFTHPSFSAHQSMPRFAKMIETGMLQKGHEVMIWSPKAFFFKIAFNNTSLEKWLGYIDQYIVFPMLTRIRLRKCSKDTLFVFADNALGPWIPLVKNKHHVVHCHDFLAQQSAFGLLPENEIGITGKYYQKFIRWGYRKAQNFISISNNTQTDLHYFLTKQPTFSKVVYNGLNQNFEPVQNKMILRKVLSNKYDIDLLQGYVLHVGGNAFYKNRLGVLEIYDQWAKDFTADVPLILVGEPPSDELIAFKERSAVAKSIFFITNCDNFQVQEFYQGASVLLFPSLYEGFGWPIVEAMASGSLVITTNENPMKEVAADAGFYITKKPNEIEKVLDWKITAAKELEKLIHFSSEELKEAISKSIIRSKEFSTIGFVNAIEKAYQQIVRSK